MLSETIKSRLAERFSAPLPEFHKRDVGVPVSDTQTVIADRTSGNPPNAYSA